MNTIESLDNLGFSFIKYLHIIIPATCRSTPKKVVAGKGIIFKAGVIFKLFQQEKVI